MSKNLGLIPIRNFGVIAPGVYRSAQPMYNYEFRWLSAVLGLRHIVSLREESRHSDMALPFGVKVHHIDVPDHQPPTIKKAAAFMRLIQACKEPILIHCEHGHGRTSTFSVLAKMALGWTLEKALRDEKRRFHYTFRHHHQLDFLTQNF